MKRESDDPRQWFAKAEADRASALILVKSGVGVRDVVCFHAQQCGETYLKG